MDLRFAGIVLVCTLCSCALSHGRPGDDEMVAGLPAPVIGDWTFAAPICDSVNRVVWVTLCPDGTAWLSDFEDLSADWHTFERHASVIDDRSVRFDPTEAGNAFESTTLELDTDEDAMVWTERVGAEWGCGEIESSGTRGRPEGAFFSPLPAHSCP